MKQIQLGMIGTGRIAKRFVQECLEVPYVKLCAIYNPHDGSSQRFAIENNLCDCMATTDMEAFLDKIDAVYIAAPHGTHFDYAKLALEQEKHVLCEKPMCLRGDEAIELYQMARGKGLVLMEAIKTAYCPGFQESVKLAQSGKIGTVHDVEACFSKIGLSALREVWDIETGGSYTELGTYVLLPIVKLMGVESKESHFWSLPARTGVDSYTKATITYDCGIATVKTGLGVKSEGQLIIAGSNGYILVPSPWWLTKRVEIHYEDPTKVEVYEYPFEGSGLRYEIASFVKKVLALMKMQERYKSDAKILPVIWNHVMQIDGVTPEESIWLARQMECFCRHKKHMCKMPVIDKKAVKIWAHRGCSLQYPENTLIAFEAAAKLPGLTGIELDIQLTKDGELVVIHDEMLERTTTGTKYVKEYTLAELKTFQITGSGQTLPYKDEAGNNLTIPTLREVFELLSPYCKEKGFMINIELKNSEVRYKGMEQKVIDLVTEYGLDEYIIYSSFLHESMGLIKTLNPAAKTGVLAENLYDCIQGAKTYNSDALHPCISGMDINCDIHQEKVWQQTAVRAWNMGEPFYGENRQVREDDLRRYAVFGVTDIFTNIPERYLKV